uniref:Uncharacterized protein n=1 Tax=Angiostrongylus cantonensis TaxID=6313 RepID=A0A0K0CXA8_ANGCA
MLKNGNGKRKELDMLGDMTDGTAGSIIGNPVVTKGGVKAAVAVHGYTATGCGSTTSGDGGISTDEASEILLLHCHT